MPTNPSAKPTRHPRLASRVVDGEAVLVDPERNVVRMLNTVGSRIWELADGTRTVDEIADALTEEFEVEAPEARQSVVEFVDELADKELLVWA
ncbi:MAG TPA: PqqD family protein [Ardenticatenaceae bacterium]